MGNKRQLRLATFQLALMFRISLLRPGKEHSTVEYSVLFVSGRAVGTRHGDIEQTQID
jgi:hypothetical protein